jgi:hypothetical protein
VISGAALVVASVLPAALNPSPAPRPSDSSVSSSTTETRPRRPARKSTLAFEPDCGLPFDAIKTDGLTIDETCTADGNAGDDVGKRLESNAKNNFCVEEAPVPITYEDFTKLETAADNIGGLRNMLKTSRDHLLDLLTQTGGTKLGEGRLVQFVGFLFDAHFSNVGKGKGELVNCKLPTREDNDIHIELMKDGVEKDPCNSVTAEMSPHFRPEAWDQLVGLEIDRPIRITGPLFFDGSHHPCHDDVRVSPNRISVWELHPVYQFEVCSINEKTLSKCDVKNNSLWIPLDKWHSTESEEEQ